ncbi:MAG: HXXEE domain-containing protein [Lachnospiraceae bacterium]|nr:HXXEE domain-containing protein [Lachnospiraceae bacterium]
MEKYIWLFPIIFIFHDMEEIIGFGIWLQKNTKMLAEKYPFVLKTYNNFSTEGFDLAVFEELIVCIAFSALALYTNTEFFRLLWLGGFIACTLHFIIHIGQSIIIRQYIPSLITSIICLPISIWIISECISILILQFNIIKIVLFSLIGIIVVLLNLKFAQSLIGKLQKNGSYPI